MADDDMAPGAFDRMTAPYTPSPEYAHEVKMFHLRAEAKAAGRDFVPTVPDLPCGEVVESNIGAFDELHELLNSEAAPQAERVPTVRDLLQVLIDEVRALAKLVTRT